MIIAIIFIISLMFTYATYMIENRHWKQFVTKYGITVSKDMYNRYDSTNINIENVNIDFLEIIKINKNYYLFKAYNKINEQFFSAFPMMTIIKYIDDFICCGTIKIDETTIIITYKIQISGVIAILIIITTSFYTAYINRMIIIIPMIITAILLFFIINSFYSNLGIIKSRMKWFIKIQ